MSAEQKGSHVNLFLSAFIINIVYFGAGESNVWTSPAVPRLHEKFPPGEVDESFLVSCFAIGQVFGPLIGGLFMDSLGRKPTTFLMLLFLVVGSALLELARTPLLLYAARIIGGLAFAMSVSVLPVYVAEITDPQMRGTLNSLPLASRSLGYFVMYSVGPLLNYDQLALASVVAPCLGVLLFFLLPESPHHLFAKGKDDAARQTVRWLKGKGASEEAIQAEIDCAQKSVDEMRSRKGRRGSTVALLTSRATCRALLISTGLLFFLQMSGIPVVMSITQSLFHAARVDQLSPHLCTLVFGGVMLAVGLAGPCVTRRFGYKRPLVTSAVGMSLSLAVFGTHFYLIELEYDMSKYSLVPLCSLVACIGFYSLGFSNSAFAVVGELFSADTKAAGTSVTNSVGFACALLSIQFFYAMKRLYGVHFGIWCFAATNAGAAIFTLLVVPDTSGMQLSEIQEMLNRPWFDRRNKVVPVEQYTKKELV